MWSNVIAARYLCSKVFGYEPDIDGFDEKPMHFNESGCKSKKTLDWAGSVTVPVTEGVDLSRKRWTAMTYVS
eukprot:13089912-Alexandrium_andersonii.AAC.1